MKSNLNNCTRRTSRGCIFSIFFHFDEQRFSTKKIFEIVISKNWKYPGKLRKKCHLASHFIFNPYCFEFLAFLCKVRGGRNKQNKLNWVSKFAAKQKDENWQKSFRKEIFCIFLMLIHRNRKNESTKATKTSHTQVAKLSFNFVRYGDTLGCNSIWSSKIKNQVLWSKLRFGFRRIPFQEPSGIQFLTLIIKP